MKKLFLFVGVVVLFAACQKNEVMQDDLMLKGAVVDGVELVGEHYNLNLIGVGDKTMKDDLAAGNVIFVDLYGITEIGLVEGDDYAVLDKNGTDGEALLQLPDPGLEPYVTELPDGYDTETDYSVYARPLGKPLTGSTIELIADLSDLALTDYIEDKKEKRVWENLLEDYEVISIAWGDQLANPVTFERLKGKQEWQNVTSELLTVVYEIIVTYDSDPGDGVTEVTETFHVRIPIFDEMLEGEYWKYDNNGLKLLQLRFYPFKYDVSQDDGWWEED